MEKVGVIPVYSAFVDNKTCADCTSFDYIDEQMGRGHCSYWTKKKPKSWMSKPFAKDDRCKSGFRPNF